MNGIATPASAVDQRAFMVALEAHQRRTGLRRDLGEIGIDLRQSRRAIDLRLACAEQVQVRAVQDQDVHETRIGCLEQAARNFAKAELYAV
jgi:hypothetical protein